MSEQYPGGYLTGSPVIPTASRAPGMWSLSQQAAYQAAGTWPAVPDAKFNYVTMLLNGDGANGAQNNTFLESANGFTVTRNGNPPQGSFSPYGANWSNYFDGSGDYLTVTNATPLQVLGGSFTLECWIFLTAAQSNMGIIGIHDNSTAGYFIRLDTSIIRFYTSAATVDRTYAFAQNTWYHIAVVSSGTTGTLYINGVAQGATFSTNGTQDTTNQFIVGKTTTLTNYFSGYISNVRVVKGTAVYTGDFTPPTAPLTAISGTSLLTCSANRFIDSSAYAYTITKFGNTSVQRLSPFGASTPYTAAAIGGSGYFDGADDYLSNISGGTALTFGTGDFTVEGWVYPTVADTNGLLQISANATGLNASPSNSTAVFQAAGTWQIYAANGTRTSAAYTINLNSWYHFACVRASGTTKLYINGVQVITYADTTNYTGSYMCIGAAYQTGFLTDGYLSDIRVVKGTALYTASGFNLPTAPLTTISGTSALFSFTNAGIYDSAEINNLTTVGNAQISTSVSKYGTGVISLPAVGDYVFGTRDGTRGGSFQFGTGDFTVECWVYFTSGAGTDVTIVTGTGSGDFMFRIVGAEMGVGQNAIQWDNYSTSLSWSNNTWYYITVSRRSGVVYFFRNGTACGSGANTVNYNVVSTFYIGQTGGGYHLNGYIDDFRVTNGYGRYTTSFTPPTQALPNYGPV